MIRPDDAGLETEAAAVGPSAIVMRLRSGTRFTGA